MRLGTNTNLTRLAQANLDVEISFVLQKKKKNELMANKMSRTLLVIKKNIPARTVHFNTAFE